MKTTRIVIAAFALTATAAFANSSMGISAQSQDESTVKQAQQALNDKGYDAGTPDGKAGPHTQAALKKFQSAQGLTGSGQLDSQTLAALGVQGDTSATQSGTLPGASSSSDTSTSPSTSSSPSSSSSSSDSSRSSSASPSSMTSSSSGTK